jgi:hypothetical protein
VPKGTRVPVKGAGAFADTFCGYLACGDGISRFDQSTTAVSCTLFFQFPRFHPSIAPLPSFLRPNSTGSQPLPSFLSSRVHFLGFNPFATCGAAQRFSLITFTHPPIPNLHHHRSPNAILNPAWYSELGYPAEAEAATLALAYIALRSTPTIDKARSTHRKTRPIATSGIHSSIRVPACPPRYLTLYHLGGAHLWLGRTQAPASQPASQPPASHSP